MAEVTEATAQAQTEAPQASAEASPKPQRAPRSPRKPQAAATDTSEASTPSATNAQPSTQEGSLPQAVARAGEGARRNRDQPPFEPWYVLAPTEN